MRFISDAQRRAVFSNIQGHKFYPPDFTHYVKGERPNNPGKPILLPRMLTADEVAILQDDVDAFEDLMTYGIVPRKYAILFNIMTEDEKDE